MEPHQRIRNTLCNLLPKLLTTFGHDFIRKNGFTPNALTFFMYALNGLGFISCIYTIIWYDIATGLNSIGYGAVNIQLVTKILLMRYAQEITEFINKIIAVYEANAKTKSPKRAAYLSKVSSLSEKVLIVGTIGYMLVIPLHLINPIYGYFWQHEYRALFPLYIPFVDETTSVGFIILMSIQSIEAFGAMASSACADLLFMIFALNIWILPTIFEDMVNDLSDMLCKKKRDGVLATDTKLRNIVECYYHIWKMIDDLNTMTFENNFIVVLFAAIAAAVELFICLKIGFMPAIFIASIFLIQIIGTCAIGTICVFCYEQMGESLIHCDWYLLPIDEQMKFKFLIMHVSMDKTLTLGGIRPLNMELCVSILRKIYTYVMILRKIIN